MQISELDLAEPALTAAILLRKKHPQVIFTSGRRGVVDQARAMASNVVKERRWIEQTYRDTPERKELQSWVDTHPMADTRDELQAGFMAVMRGWSEEQKGRLSKHFNGQAFDVQPLAPGPQATAIKATIRSLPGLTKFLEKEGGLIRWHAQFA